MDDVHPDVLNRYYGVHGSTKTRSSHMTGAGHPEDELDDSASESDSSEGSENDGDGSDREVEELENRIAGDQHVNIRHEPIKVASHRPPFSDPLDLLSRCNTIWIRCLTRGVGQWYLS